VHREALRCHRPIARFLPADVEHLLEDHTVALAVKRPESHHVLGHYCPLSPVEFRRTIADIWWLGGGLFAASGELVSLRLRSA
jgi:hypothetical protein